MSGALVVFEHKSLVNRRHEQVGLVFSADRRRMAPKVLPGRNAETGRSDWFVVQNRAEMYGPDARIISKIPPGLLVDIYA